VLGFVILCASLCAVGLAMAVTCGSCCLQCTIFTDNFASDDRATNWNNAVGWTISGGVLTVVNANDNIWTVASGTQGHGRASVSAKADTTGDVLRVVGSFVDTANFLYGELTLNGASSTWKLFKRVAGVNTQLGSTKTVSTSLSTFYTLEVCWNGTTATAYLGGTTSYILATYTGTGNKAGLGATNANTATFDDFAFTNHIDDKGDCTACMGTGGGVDGGCSTVCTEATPSMQMVVAGMADNGSCSGGTYCTDWNATWLLTAATPCDWRYQDDTLLVCGPTEVDRYIRVHFENRAGNVATDLCWLGDDGFALWNFDKADMGIGAAPGDCTKIQGVSVPFSANSGIGHICNGASATATLTML
jgi:hypothetical protein